MTEERLKKEIFDILSSFPKNTNFYSEQAKRVMAESIAKRINKILKEKK